MFQPPAPHEIPDSPKDFVQQLVAQPTIEALNEGVLHRLAWGDVVPRDLLPIRPGKPAKFRTDFGLETGSLDYDPKPAVSIPQGPKYRELTTK